MTFVSSVAWIAPAARIGAQTSATPSVPYVETTGFGERRVAPDRATAMVNVTTRATSAATAAAENARIQQRVMDTLRTLGLGNAATTASYNVGLDYEPREPGQPPPRRLYAARAGIRVRLTDIGMVGRVIDAALARGATGIDGVFFESSMAESARRAAMGDAAAMARADAEALAKAMGGELGPIISVTTNPGDRLREMAMMRTTMAGGSVGGMPTQITPSEIVITSGVIVRWQLKT